jgi:dTDP-glucose 4,6-dehydratase
MWWEHHNNKVGKTCNIGGFNKWNNTDLMRLLYKLIAEKLGR